jgi:Thiol-disulfide isomerase and thioredoxins
MRRLVPVVAAAALLLAGCTSQDGIAGQNGGGYISGDGTVLLVPEESRVQVPAWGGDTVDGETVASADLDGVVVLNFWYAGCPPCRVEAPDLEAVSVEYADRVAFLGVNIRDSAATAESFEREFGVTYDSILDAGSKDVMLAFAGDVPPSAVPTTLVLDARGRVAARISGRLPSQTTLSDILDDVLAEDS